MLCYFVEIFRGFYKNEKKMASTWNFDTYHLGYCKVSGRLAHLCNLIRAFTAFIQSIEVVEGLDKN